MILIQKLSNLASTHLLRSTATFSALQISSPNPNSSRVRSVNIAPGPNGPILIVCRESSIILFRICTVPDITLGGASSRTPISKKAITWEFVTSDSYRAARLVWWGRLSKLQTTGRYLFISCFGSSHSELALRKKESVNLCPG